MEDYNGNDGMADGDGDERGEMDVDTAEGESTSINAILDARFTKRIRVQEIIKV